MQVAPNFILQEFIAPEVYQTFGDNSIWLIDRRIIDIAQYIRTTLNRPVTINNWHVGGNYKDSGLRSLESLIGAKYGQHKFGRAVDPKVKGMTPINILDFIYNKWVELHKLGLTTVENIAHTPTWNHLDVRMWMDNELHIVQP